MSQPPRHACSPADFVASTWGLKGEFVPLAGDVDENWRFTAETGERFVLKIAPPATALDPLAAEANVQARLGDEGWPVPVPLAVPGGRGHARFVAQAPGGWARLSSWLDGTPWCDIGDTDERFPRVLGRFLARLDRALSELEAPERSHAWDVLESEALLARVDAVPDRVRRERVRAWLESFRDSHLADLRQRPKTLVHDDANDHNVLLDEHGAIAGLIDFGDALASVRVAEPAIAGAYLAMHAGAHGARELIRAYDAEWPLHASERAAFVACLRVRLITTAVVAAERETTRDDPYAAVHAEPAWRVLDGWEADAWEALERELAE